MQRLLIVKLADIGDLLTATPALRALRQRYPAARLDLLTTPHAAAIVPRSLVDGLLAAPRNLIRGPADLASLIGLLAAIRRARYDGLIFLHHLTLAAGVAKYRLLAAASAAPLLAGLDNGKGGWLTRSVPDMGFGAYHEVEYWLQVAALLDARTTDTRLAAQFDADDLAVAGQLLGKDRGQPRVAIHPGSGGYAPARRWEPEKWAAVADALITRYRARIILVGGPEDGVAQVQAAMREEALDLAGRTTLPQLAALLSQCQLFLGADSGVMHLAAAVGAPLVALFGPSNQRAWGPWTPAGCSVVVRLGLDCSPCSYVRHSVGQRDGCWHRSCLADLQPERVLLAVQQLGALAEDGDDRAIG